jgi:hypothetical protein
MRVCLPVKPPKRFPTASKAFAAHAGAAATTRPVNFHLRRPGCLEAFELMKASQIENANRVVKTAIELNADLKFVVLGHPGLGAIRKLPVVLGARGCFAFGTCARFWLLC